MISLLEYSLLVAWSNCGLQTFADGSWLCFRCHFALVSLILSRLQPVVVCPWQTFNTGSTCASNAKARLFQQWAQLLSWFLKEFLLQSTKKFLGSSLKEISEKNLGVINWRIIGGILIFFKEILIGFQMKFLE